MQAGWDTRAGAGPMRRPMFCNYEPLHLPVASARAPGRWYQRFALLMRRLMGPRVQGRQREPLLLADGATHDHVAAEAWLAACPAALPALSPVTGHQPLAHRRILISQRARALDAITLWPLG